VIISSQVPVGGTAVKLIAVPPGPSNLVITNGGTATMYVGGGTTATVTGNGGIAAGATVTIPGFPASSATQLWGITAGTASAPIVTASMFLSTGS
jgi:hypothetical protein